MSLNNGSTRTDRVLSKRMTLFNHNTGEILEKNEEIRLKAKTREEFFLVFTNNFKYLTDVPKMSLKVLASILTHYVSWNNEILLTSVSRKDLAQKNNTTIFVVYQSISKLIESGIFIKQDSRLFLNPHIFSRGTWNDIQKMRQEIVFDYDFEKLEAKTTLNVTSLDKNMPQLNEIKVVEHNQYKEDNIEHTEVVIEKKENIIDESVIDVEVQEKNINQKEFELEILKENNRANEIKIKEIELKNKAKELELKEMELKIKLKELELQESSLKKDRNLFD